MAVVVGRPRRPVNEVLKMFAEQTKEDFTINFMTQRIWPYEVYPGYAEVNKRREKEGRWFSTGKGIESFDVWVENADLGAGIWGDAQDIQRNKKADHVIRYNKWNVGRKRTHRPAIMMQLRHLQTRMRNYASDFYGYEGLGKVFGMIDGITIDLWDGVFNLKNPNTGL